MFVYRGHREKVKVTGAKNVSVYLIRWWFAFEKQCCFRTYLWQSAYCVFTLNESYVQVL